MQLAPRHSNCRSAAQLLFLLNVYSLINYFSFSLTLFPLLRDKYCKTNSGIIKLDQVGPLYQNFMSDILNQLSRSS